MHGSAFEDAQVGHIARTVGSEWGPSWPLHEDEQFGCAYGEELLVEFAGGEYVGVGGRRHDDAPLVVDFELGAGFFGEPVQPGRVDGGGAHVSILRVWSGSDAAGSPAPSGGLDRDRADEGRACGVLSNLRMVFPLIFVRRVCSSPN
jgi:hypothetical protein